VAAGGPDVPEALLTQLALEGRLVIPVGADEGSQVLTRVTREGLTAFRREAILEVRFVPLIGEQGWPEEPQLRATRKKECPDAVAPPATIRSCREVPARPCSVGADGGDRPAQTGR
jgi:hypothetical protein